MEANDLRGFAVVEVTTDGVADFVVQFLNSGGLGENRSAERAGGVATLRGFLDDEDQLFHGGGG